MNEWTGDNTEQFLVMGRDAVRAVDAWAIEQMKIPGVVLMENAGKNCTDVILSEFSKECQQGVTIFCGAGNNGGDGFVIARHLSNHDVSVHLAICADPVRIQGDAKVHYDICRQMGLSMGMIDAESADLCRQVENAIGNHGLLVDAVLGTGLQGELKSAASLLISGINSHNIPIVAVDIPSGLDCDKGVPLPVCIEAAATVTFVAIKKGFAVCPAACKVTGRVFVADIGIVPVAS